MSKVGYMKKRSWFQRLLRWLGIGIGVIALFALGYFVAQSGLLDPLVDAGSGGTANVPGGAGQNSLVQRGAALAQEEGGSSTVPVRSAESAVGVVSAAGNLELANEHQIVVEVNGIVSELLVKVGDTVEEGQLLVVLDSREAERAVEQALLAVATAQADYNDQLDGADPLEIAAAEASLRAAQENLADVMAGPSDQ
jgi:multidrug efflux pump subunit AcrA (membrane-fusion protein)